VPSIRVTSLGAGLRVPGLVAMRTSFGRYGVPLDVVYGPGGPEGLALSELLTQTAIMDVVRRAGAARKEAAE